MMKLKINLKYFIATILLFLIEVLIATKLSHLFFVRAYLGDVIVVILLYTFVKSFIQINNNQKLNLGIFLFSCVIEFAQYFHIAEKLGFKAGSLMYIVIGNSFSWIDILCYAVGCLFVYLFIKINDRKGISSKSII